MRGKQNINHEILHVDLKDGFLPAICEVFVTLFGILLDKEPSINLTYYDDDCWQNRSYICASGGQSILFVPTKNPPFIYTNISEKSKAEMSSLQLGCGSVVAAW